jgi:hypothetical protein
MLYLCYTTDKAWMIGKRVPVVCQCSISWLIYDAIFWSHWAEVYRIMLLYVYREFYWQYFIFLVQVAIMDEVQAHYGTATDARALIPHTVLGWIRSWYWILTLDRTGRKRGFIDLRPWCSVREMSERVRSFDYSYLLIFFPPTTQMCNRIATWVVMTTNTWYTRNRVAKLQAPQPLALYM